jgi:hypothetical protein
MIAIWQEEIDLGVLGKDVLWFGMTWLAGCC